MDPNTIAMMQKMGVQIPTDYKEPDEDEVMKIMMENGFGGPKTQKPKAGMSEEDAILA